MDTQQMFECLLATMKTNQEDLLARLEAKTDTTLTTVKEEMQAGIHSIQSELENTNQQTQNLHKELTEKIEKTRVELQVVEVALDAQAKEFREEIAAIRADRTFYENHSQIEATKHEPQARLEAIEARAQPG
jgi:oligoribonuclease (3'-5' exoribonuclease)